MIKMTYGYVQKNPDFGQAMRKLLTTATQQKLAYAAKKINDKLQSQRAKIVEEYRKILVEKFAQLDDKGEVKPNPEDPKQFLRREGVTEEDFAKASDEFWNQEFTIDREKLALSDLAAIQFTAMDLMALEPLYEDSDEE